MSCPSWKTIVIAHLQNVRAALRFSAKIWKQPGSKLHVIVASNLLCEYTGCPRLSHIYYRGWIRKQFCTSRCFQTDHRPRCYFRLKVFRKVGLFVSPRQLPSLSVFYISKPHSVCLGTTYEVHHSCCSSLQFSAASDRAESDAFLRAVMCSKRPCLIWIPSNEPSHVAGFLANYGCGTRWWQAVVLSPPFALHKKITSAHIHAHQYINCWISVSDRVMARQAS